MGADFGVFWNMVWQEKVCKIVMLTNLKEQGVTYKIIYHEQYFLARYIATVQTDL